QLGPGQTLCLRGGTYYERVKVTAAGTAERPVILRSHPGELAVIDAGLREFFEDPASAWEPVEKGAPGEYRSAKAYPGRAGKKARRAVAVLGNFGDSMVPLHGYRFAADFRTDNELWNLGKNDATDAGLYLG